MRAAAFWTAGRTTRFQMSDKTVFAINVDTGEEVSIDLDYAIEERIAIYANSGGGKSYLVRCLAEKNNKKVQQIIISPKKEFVSLREKFDYIHVGMPTEKSKPDIELNLRYAEQLALKILESGVDAVIEFSEFVKDRIAYVDRFVEAITNAPEHLWHPCMIVIDEIDIWAPEKGHGEASSLGAIIDLAARGRDKGFFLVAATQKLAKFNKDVASELNIKFIGKCSLDIDQTRACQELGIPLKEKGKLRELGRPNFYFYAFGPGLSDDVIKIKAMEVQTTHISGYKRNKNLKPIPTPEKIKKMLEGFAGLDKEAEKEIKTKEDMLKRIREQEMQIKVLQKQQPPKIDPSYVKKAEDAAYAKGYNFAKMQIEKLYKEKMSAIDVFYGRLKTRLGEVQQLADQIKHKTVITDALDTKIQIELKEPPTFTIPSQTQLAREMSKQIMETPFPPNPPSSSSPVDFNGDLSKQERQVLLAICQLEKCTRDQVAILSQYSLTSGAFGQAISLLKQKGYVLQEGIILKPTDAGIKVLGPYEPLPTDHDEIIRTWRGKLGEQPDNILTVLAKAYPQSLSRQEIADETKYSVKSGSFGQGISTLLKMSLIESDGQKLKASKNLWPLEIL